MIEDWGIDRLTGCGGEPDTTSRWGNKIINGVENNTVGHLKRDFKQFVYNSCNLYPIVLMFGIVNTHLTETNEQNSTYFVLFLNDCQ